MLARKASLIVAAATMALATTVSAQAAPFAERLATPVTNANYQADDDDDDGSLPVLLGVLLIILIGFAAVSGGGDDEPASP